MASRSAGLSGVSGGTVGRHWVRWRGRTGRARTDEPVWGREFRARSGAAQGTCRTAEVLRPASRWCAGIGSGQELAIWAGARDPLGPEQPRPGSVPGGRSSLRVTGQGGANPGAAERLSEIRPGWCGSPSDIGCSCSA